MTQSDRSPDPLELFFERFLPPDQTPQGYVAVGTPKERSELIAMAAVIVAVSIHGDMEALRLVQEIQALPNVEARRRRMVTLLKFNVDEGIDDVLLRVKDILQDRILTDRRSIERRLPHPRAH